MNESDKTLRTAPSYLACSTAGGGVMFIPDTIERMQSDIIAAELNMDNAVSYNDLFVTKDEIQVTPASKNFINRSMDRAKKLLAKAS